jgi:hypothetical protein
MITLQAGTTPLTITTHSSLVLWLPLSLALCSPHDILPAKMHQKPPVPSHGPLPVILRPKNSVLVTLPGETRKKKENV